MKDNINKVIKNELCTGCGACNFICSVKAIDMNFTSHGRLLPKIDETKCIQCGLCLSACPGIDETGKLSKKIDSDLIGEVKDILFGRSTNETIFSNAQSGGAVTETLAFLFDENLIEAALVVTQAKQRALFKVLKSKESLLHTQSSQYTPVDLLSGLSLLEKYSHVAVIGLPCHIEGIVKLRETFPKKLGNIDYLLGLICAGTLSQLIVDVVKNVGGKRIGNVTDEDTIFWRHKKYSNYENADIAIVKGNGMTCKLSNEVRLISKPFLTSPRCNLCFDKLNLYSDIVFGDAWGITGDDTSKGGNVIISRTSKGSALITAMMAKGRIFGKPCSVTEVVYGQGMEKKKETVKKMVEIYRDKSLLLPGWAAIFSTQSPISKNDILYRNMDDYIRRENIGAKGIVHEVSVAIKQRTTLKYYFKCTIKRILNKMFK